MKRYLSFAFVILLSALIFGPALHSQVVPQPPPPTPIACAYNTSPATLTNGQAGWAQCDSAGNIKTSATITPSGTQDVNQTQVNSTAVAVGNGIAGIGVQRVTVASDNTPFPVKIDQTTPGTTNAVSLAQIGATTTATGNGVAGAGVQRVAVASDNTPFGVTQSGTWNFGTLTSITNPVAVTGTFWQATQPVSAASLPLPTGASTAAKQPALGTAGTPSADVLTVQGVTSMTALKVDGSAVTQPISGSLTSITNALPAGSNIIGNFRVDQTTPGTTNAVSVSQIGATTVSSGNGVVGAGVQRVAIASDNTPYGVKIAPSATAADGITPVVSASAEATHVLKASAGNLYSVYATNLTSTAGFLTVLNATSAPGDGAITPLECVYLPANGSAALNYNSGPPAVFSTGITVVITSATTCFTKTTGVITAFIKGAAQ